MVSIKERGSKSVEEQQGEVASAADIKATIMRISQKAVALTEQEWHKRMAILNLVFDNL